MLRNGAIIGMSAPVSACQRLAAPRGQCEIYSVGLYRPVPLAYRNLRAHMLSHAAMISFFFWKDT